MTAACANDSAAAEKPAAACEQLLSASERARMQWKLETEFAKFEKKY
jgi:adenosine deaminase